MKKSLNTFADNAPRPDWIRAFFAKPTTYFKDNRLSDGQIGKFRRFLYDAELVKRRVRTITEFTELIKKIGWNSATAWGLILVNLVDNNPQMRWYVDNLPVGKEIPRKVVEGDLQARGISVRSSRSIAKAFNRLCDTPLGSELHFGTTMKKRKSFVTLKRTKATVDDGRVILYSLFKFAEAADGRYQFTLSHLENESMTAGASPMKIFGIKREEMQQFLNGLSTKYSDFINATFTHDLEKISLSAEKNSQDVLNLFDR